MANDIQQDYKSLVDFIRNQSHYRNSMSLRINPDDLEPLSRALEEQIKGCNKENQEALHDAFFDFGPLKSLFEDETITEILLNGDLKVHVIKNGIKIPEYRHFLGKASQDLCYSKILESAKIQLNHDCPFRDAQFKSFRLHVIGPPLSSQQRISLRRTQHSNRRTISYDSDFYDPKKLDQLIHFFLQGDSMLVVGPTGSGKTSFISYLLSHLPKTERCLILEETPEIRIPNSLSVALNTWTNANWSSKGFDLGHLLKQVLRMKPDRIILGEMRAEEAKDFLLNLSSGHRGSVSTIHSSNAREALIRLEMLVKMGAPQWSNETIHQLISLSLNIIVVLDLSPQGRRSVKEVFRLEGLGHRGPLLDPIYKRQEDSH